MKTKLILILIVILSACNNKKAEIELNTEVIIDVTQKENYLNDLFEYHPDKQVKVYSNQTSVIGNDKMVYVVYVFRKAGGTKVSMGFVSPDTYNKACYEWKNDSTFYIKVYNSTNNRSTDCTYVASGGSCGLWIDSINHISTQIMNPNK